MEKKTIILINKINDEKQGLASIDYISALIDYFFASIDYIHASIDY